MTGEEEGAVDRRAFAFTVVGTKDNKVEGIAYAGEIIFFDL